MLIVIILVVNVNTINDLTIMYMFFKYIVVNWLPALLLITNKLSFCNNFFCNLLSFCNNVHVGFRINCLKK